jgi:hypothetical protein
MALSSFRGGENGVRGHRRSAGAATVVLMGVSVLAPALASAGVAPTAGVNAVYTGRSSQGFAVRLSRPTAIGRTFRYRATMSCNDGTRFTDATFSDVVGLNRHGRFQVRYVSDHGATITDVRGSIRGRRASGTIAIGEHFSSTPDAQGNYPLDPHGTVWCRSPVVHWRATAR